MSWDLDDDTKDMGNTDRVYEIQEGLGRQKDEFLDIKEKFKILEPRAVGYRKAIDKWYPKQLSFVGSTRTLLESLREGFNNAVDPSDKLEEGLNDMFSLEDLTGSKFKNRVGNDMLQSLADYIKDCKSHSKCVEKWEKSCNMVEHYIKKVLELSTNLNVANNTGKEKLVKKLREKFDRNKYKLDTTAAEHAVIHDEVKLQLTNFWDARGDFFDNIIKDLLFWQQTFLKGHADVLEKSLKSLGLNSLEIDKGADTVMKLRPGKKDTVDHKEDEKLEENAEDYFNEDDVQWADDPSPCGGW